jgi:hypothetical protein
MHGSSSIALRIATSEIESIVDGMVDGGKVKREARRRSILDVESELEQSAECERTAS